MADQAEYNAQVFRSKGLNEWRKIYISIIGQLNMGSIVEYGAGDPELLAALPKDIKKTAVDGTDTYKDTFQEKGIELIVQDLDKSGLSLSSSSEMAVCSDVFEHLINPSTCLYTIADNLTPSGVLFAHVPNEFVFRKTIGVMILGREAIYSHKHCNEWDHPHLHRFTDTGFKRFLGQRFEYLLKIADLKKTRINKISTTLGISVPYCLEGGPTYACTNDKNTFDKLSEIKQKLLK